MTGLRRWNSEQEIEENFRLAGTLNKEIIQNDKLQEQMGKLALNMAVKNVEDKIFDEIKLLTK